MFKQIITILSLGVVMTAHAQTRKGNYCKVTTDHWNTKTDQSTTTIKRKVGTLCVNDKTIVIDSTGEKPQAYAIVKRGNVETYDYGDFIQGLYVLYPAKTGLKAEEVILYISKDRKTITDVIFKRTAHSNVTYTFQ